MEPSELRGISFEDLNTKMISEAANRGDTVAKEAFEYTGRILGMKLADTVVHTDPQAIFFIWWIGAGWGSYFQADVISHGTKFNAIVPWVR